MPRPSLYSDELASKICTQLLEGQSLRKICRKPGMPCTSTVFAWLNDKPEFRTRYIRAREMQAELLADEIIEIADNTEGMSASSLTAAKLRIDSRKWIAARLLPKKYGEKISQELSGPDGGPLLHSQLEPDEFEEIARRLNEEI